MAGYAGALMVILRKQIQNTLTKVLGAKLVGKVGLRFVPYVGWLLIAWDVIDATQAKVQLETSLRDIFVEEYRAELTPELVWNKSRDDVQNEFRKGINLWGREGQAGYRGDDGSCGPDQAPLSRPMPGSKSRKRLAWKNWPVNYVPE